FLFVVMMLDVNIAAIREGFIRYLPVGILAALLIIAVMAMVVGGDYFQLDQMPAPTPHGADYSNTKELGMLLYTVYVYPFEIASVILVVAIIAAIALTLRRRPGTKYQNMDAQVAVRRNDRVRMVKMKSEERK
ncbi:MAG: NADH-quinone oxidoreductase subunit J, partial [Gammaproteobacteria bacterium]|nr:NADH-quinone oxidoreductase subunit J [Gammaproteobacteria bacterium]